MTDTTAVRPVPTRLAARSWPAGLARPPGWIGYIYLHLWLGGYRRSRLMGPCF